ncbi:hypothetical protein HDA40_000765 [Hamadaea flava]|uniref:Uncharacterized protein n=1 Tax=Hamadaea flava TaxID=1742688 RepID=A0ABV8LQ26_9ACTN|nr:hypothetical protein [Hamadaea flava]MCP2322258.1 hypothetical protein [Hamadaea flava]
MTSLKKLAVAAILATTGLLATTTQGAYASGSTTGYIAGTDNGYIYHYVAGDGNTIDSQTAKIYLYGGDIICNFYINWVYLDTNSKPWYTERAYTNTGCVSAPGLATDKTAVVAAWRGKGWAKNGYACAYVFTNGSQRGRACVRIN